MDRLHLDLVQILGQPYRKRAALTYLALHEDVSVLQIHRLPHDRQSETGSLVPACQRTVDLLEPLEDLSPDDVEWHRRLIRALDPAHGDGDTIYLCAMDRDGMAVSLNQSLYQGFGSGVTVPGTGVLLHGTLAVGGDDPDR